MNIHVKAGKVADLSTEALVLGLYEGAALSGFAKDADQASGGLISDVLQSGDFKGKPNQVLVLHTPKSAIKRFVLLGLGKDGEVNLEKLRCAGGKAATSTRDLGVKAFTMALPATNLEAAESAQAFAEGSLLSLFQMNDYRTTNREEIKVVEEITFLADEAGLEAAKKGVGVAEVLNDSITLTRTLVVHPGNVVTPARLAEEAQKMGAECGLKVTVFGKDELTKMGFGGLVGVGQGSVLPPAFIVMEYHGGGDEAPIAIVGKGITFDTGGISIKPGENMDKMKYDMAGAAAAIGLMRTLAKLGVKRNVVGLIPAAENMPSGNAIKPGDVLTTYSGQTVEVLNTDAEGRLILCDAVTYAVKDKKAQAVIDMATLTGACVIALGTEAAAILGNHQELLDRILASGEKTGDRMWQLPMWKEYNEMLRSDIADMKNIAGREAGTITAACFLSRYAGETPWVHIDIAGTAWTDKDKPYRPKGPTALPLRLLVDLISNWQPLKESKGFKF